MVHSEKTRIWLLIKQSLPQLNKAEINPIEFLIWTQGKNIREVRNRILTIQSTIVSEGTWIVKNDENENNSTLKNKTEEENGSVHHPGRAISVESVKVSNNLTELPSVHSSPKKEIIT